MEYEGLGRMLAAHGKRQSDLAAFLGLGPSRLSEVVNGRRRLTVQEFLRTAEFFGITTDQLAGSLGLKQSADVSEPPRGCA